MFSYRKKERKSYCKYDETPKQMEEESECRNNNKDKAAESRR